MTRPRFKDPVTRMADALETLVQEQATSLLAKLACQLDRIEGKVDKIMATMAELENELNEINATTNLTAETLEEIAADIDNLLAGGVPTGGLSEADTNALFQKLREAREALQAQSVVQREIADKHTP